MNRAKNTLNNKKHTFRLRESDEITTKGVQTPNNQTCQCTFIGEKFTCEKIIVM